MTAAVHAAGPAKTSGRTRAPDGLDLTIAPGEEAAGRAELRRR
ncbi:unnamed protein product [[Actinomadura] parvosata subsp. kistnae]|nr:hypothetical protein [Nonomuraea sp. ATCC 55076]SPL95855.1 unnamed protein product [Actinomadura parvosata subsp. kistnae]